MQDNVMYERDLLYPTDSIFEPGCIRIVVKGPNSNAAIPIIIECKTSHSPIKYINSIVQIMQSDIFDRIYINLKKNANLYIKTPEGLKKEYNDSTYLLVRFDEDRINYVGVNEIDT